MGGKKEKAKATEKKWRRVGRMKAGGGGDGGRWKGRREGVKVIGMLSD